MPLVADRCICIRKIEYSETSQILTLFGRASGLVKTIAKGAHRTTKVGASKFGGVLQFYPRVEGGTRLVLSMPCATPSEFSPQTKFI